MNKVVKFENTGSTALVKDKIKVAAYCRVSTGSAGSRKPFCSKNTMRN